MSYTVGVSSEEQAREGVSIEVQESRLREYCKAREWDIIDIYKDEGKSAFKDNRPEFDRLKEDCHKGLFDLILVTKLDRIFRNLIEGVNTLEQWERLNKKFVSMTESFDTTTHFGKAFLRMALIFAELEVGNTSDRVKFVHEDRIKKGIHIHRPPLGYNLNEGKKWTIDRNEGNKVRTIFKRVADGENIKDIAPDIQLSPISMYYIIKNRTYLGEVKFNKKWIKGSQPSIISTLLFKKANEVINSRSRYKGREAYQDDTLIKETSSA